jgi:nitroimidazol reductase NimA-like FMN-containing flavoprotein (pyridoxamine 5'-phosphate oxidase superfamily)
MVEMSEREIEQMLSEARIGRLCMADAEGRPYAIPMPFCWADGTLYLRVPLTGRKGEILSQNPYVCFEVDEFTQTLDHYASVLIEGELVPESDVEQKARVKLLNDAKYNRLRGGHRPGHGRRTPIEELPMRKIVVTSVTGRSKERSTDVAEEVLPYAI